MKMREEKETKERLDEFSAYMRHRLEEHRLPVEASDWDLLEKRINRRPLPMAWLWGSGLAAAVILTLVVWLLPAPEEMPMSEPVFSKESSLPMPVDSLFSPKPTMILFSPEGKVLARTVVKETCLWIAPEVEIEEIPDIALKEIPLLVKTRKKSVATPETDGHQVYTAGVSNDTRVKRKGHKDGKWQLAASVGTSPSGSRLELKNTTENDPKPPNYDDDTDDKEKDGLIPLSENRSYARSTLSRNAMEESSLTSRSFESFPDISYSLPISFSFTARKMLNRSLGIESGLVYTYLSATFQQTGTYRTAVRSRLHYLGIPVNLVVNVWDHPRWNIYLSGGFTLEKGILAVYDESKMGAGRVINRTIKEDIHGLQWSVNASVGAGYRVYRDWSLYLEPRFSYFFGSGQPASIRTDKPLGIGLNAGVRFEF